MKQLTNIAMRDSAFPLLIILVSGILFSCKDESLLDTYSFPTDPVFFEHLPIDLDGVYSFVPMGEANVLPKDHGGFPIKNPYELPASIPVFAVRSGVIILAGHGTRQVNNPYHANDGMTYEDYQLRLQISKNVN